METKDTQIEGLEEIVFRVQHEEMESDNEDYSLGIFAKRLLADPAILAHIPAVKALQEELADWKKKHFDVCVLMRETDLSTDKDIATLEATNAAQAERIGELEDVEPKRPDRLAAENAIYGFLCRRGIHTDFHMAEDGDDSWSFWILHEDTTSYVHADLSIEWYGTSYGEDEATSSTPAESQLAGGEAVAELWSGLNDCARELGYDFLRPEFAHASRALVKYAPNNLGVHTAAPAIKQQVADGYEHSRAIMEGEHNAAADEYFSARPQIDSGDRRRVFEAGFTRGYRAYPTQPVSANQTDSGKVPPGYALVPIEPTPLMMNAFWTGTGSDRPDNREMELSVVLGAWRCMLAAAPSAQIAEGDEWQPIETAPKDGTVVDLWHEEFGRDPDCYFGLPHHDCGEAGRYCDSDWHGLEPSWIDGYNMPREEGRYTHWRPTPAGPKASAESGG